LERNQYNTNSLAGTRGEYTFDSLQALLAATPSMLTGNVYANTSNDRGSRDALIGWFVEDDYRVTSRLSLNLGLRHQFSVNPPFVNGFGGTFHSLNDPAPTPGPYANYAKLNFAPRVGVAWDPTGSGKTAVRAGAGVYHNQVVNPPSSGASLSIVT